jgi:hypothetical protein
MAPAPKYQALPVLREDIRRRSLPLSAIQPATEAVISSVHEQNISSPKARSSETQAFLSPPNPVPTKKNYNHEDHRLSEQDITSVISYDEGRSIQGQPNPNPDWKGKLRESHLRRLNWLPYTHRIPFLSTLFALSIALALVAILLSWVSSTRDGLGDDNKTSILLFGWRFAPTLVVVLFVILETLLLNDARRTEVFARLSNPPASANASSTVLSVRGHWWSDPFDAMSSKRNGGLRSQVLLFASVMNIIGSFVLSPLSAAFLSVEPTQISRESQFTTLYSISSATTAVSPDDETYFKAISALVVNLTTSVWLTDDYAIVPFWPAELTQPPLGATIPVTPQNWTANTTVFRAELSCSPMSMKALDTDTFEFQLVSDDGCSLGVAVGVPEADFPATIPHYAGYDTSGPMDDDAEEDAEYYFPIINSGSFWVPTSIDPDDFSTVLMTNFDYFRNQTVITNVSAACQNRYILAVNTPFNVTWSYPPGWTVTQPVNATDLSGNLASFSIQSHVCSSRYMVANLSATMSSLSPSNITVTFDETAFNQSKVELQPSDFNVSSFESAFYSDTWIKKLNTSYYGTWMGPAAALGAQYDYNVEAMMSDPLLLNKAQQVEQRFFGEGLMTAFSKAAAQGSTSTDGKIIAAKDRVVASFGIGVTMGVLFLFTSMMVVLISYYSRLSRRPLNLDRDPGSAAAMSSLLKDAPTRSHFQGLDRVPAPLIEKRLGDLHFELQAHGLKAHHTSTMSTGCTPDS